MINVMVLREVLIYIYILKIDNINICHLGDLGHIPPTLVLDKLRNIDILFIPIGGHFTLNGLWSMQNLCKLIKS